jgi:hypothetical protein
VPDELWRYCEFGRGEKYSDNQAEQLPARGDVLQAFDAWTAAFAAFVGNKGNVAPGRFRAFGYRPPGHRFADLKLKWRELRMSMGHAPPGSSPRQQHDLDLNRDATWTPGHSERERNHGRSP